MFEKHNLYGEEIFAQTERHSLSKTRKFLNENVFELKSNLREKKINQ